MISYEIKNIKELRAALKDFDESVDKQFNKQLGQAGALVAREARSLVDPEGLSGFSKTGRLAYDPSSIAAGIKVKRGGRRKRGSISSNYVGVQNMNAAGAIWEIAGRKSRGRPPQEGKRGNGEAMIAGIEKRGGRASRTIWAAMDGSAGEAAARMIESAIESSIDYLQQQINSMD